MDGLLLGVLVGLCVIVGVEDLRRWNEGRKFRKDFEQYLNDIPRHLEQRRAAHEAAAQAQFEYHKAAYEMQQRIKAETEAPL